MFVVDILSMGQLRMSIVKEQFLWDTACQAGQGMPGDTLL